MCATTETVTNQNVYNQMNIYSALKKQNSGHILQYRYMENIVWAHLHGASKKVKPMTQDGGTVAI